MEILSILNEHYPNAFDKHEQLRDGGRTSVLLVQEGQWKISIIHIVGASGAGTSTLGQALEREYGYKWMDLRTGESNPCFVLRLRRRCNEKVSPHSF